MQRYGVVLGMEKETEPFNRKIHRQKTRHKYGQVHVKYQSSFRLLALFEDPRAIHDGLGRAGRPYTLP